MVKELSPNDIFVLSAFFDECGGGLGCHPTINAIKKYLPRNLKNDMSKVKKSISKLVSAGYLTKHPTRGSKTYDLNRDGRDYILNKT